MGFRVQGLGIGGWDLLKVGVWDFWRHLGESEPDGCRRGDAWCFACGVDIERFKVGIEIERFKELKLNDSRLG